MQRRSPSPQRTLLYSHVSFLNPGQHSFFHRALHKQPRRAPLHRSHLYGIFSTVSLYEGWSERWKTAGRDAFLLMVK